MHAPFTHKSQPISHIFYILVRPLHYSHQGNPLLPRPAQCSLVKSRNNSSLNIKPLRSPPLHARDTTTNLCTWLRTCAKGIRSKPRPHTAKHATKCTSYARTRCSDLGRYPAILLGVDLSRTVTNVGLLRRDRWTQPARREERLCTARVVHSILLDDKEG